jgi:hypothetical protein
MAELPKDELLVCSVFLFLAEGGGDLVVILHGPNTFAQEGG